MTKYKIFKDIENVKDGDIFHAKVSSVEGRKVVTLEKSSDDDILDYVWDTPGLVDTVKDWINEDYTPNWSDRD
jgi:hypothetical protein